MKIFRITEPRQRRREKWEDRIIENSKDRFINVGKRLASVAGLERSKLLYNVVLLLKVGHKMISINIMIIIIREGRINEDKNIKVTLSATIALTK